jgi:ParB/RepB/Spo0J family partition protein
MPITDEYARLPLSQIYIERDERQRREINVDDIIESIRARGVMQPIIVERDLLSPPYKLRAGERRYTASLKLELPDIPVRFVQDLDDRELAIIELEENIKRQDLPWQDIVRAVHSIHRLYAQLESDWTMGETADAVGLNKSTVSMYLKVAGSLEEERVLGASTVREAYNILARRDQRAQGDALEELLGIAGDLPASVAPTDESAPISPEAFAALTPTEQQAHTTAVRNPSGEGSPLLAPARPSIADQINPAKSIIQESFLQWAPRYQGKKFNLIHCDFPYGVNLFDGQQLVTDATGAVPLRYQPGYLNPEGRVFSLELRKQF